MAPAGRMDSDISLDAPRSWSWKHTVTVGTVGSALAAVLACVGLWGPNVLTPVPAIMFAHSISLALVTGLTSFLLMGHASATQSSGYLVLGCGYLFVSVLLVGRLLSAPGAIFNDMIIIGNTQSAAWVFILWRMAFPGFLAAAAVVFLIDRRRPPAARLSVSVGSASILTLLAAVVVVTVAYAPGLLPDVVTPDPTGAATPLFHLLFRIQLAICIAATLATSLALRRGSLLSLWMFIVGLVLLTDSIVALATSQRFEFAWYAELAVILFASLVLLLGLVWQLAAVDRALTRLAATDSLTGVASRAAFMSRLDRALRQLAVDEKVGLLWLDLDGFKSVNDRYGHPFGDELLRVVAVRLSAVPLPEGSMLGRLGGDEFGVIVADPASSDDLHELAERFLSAVRKPLEIQDAQVLLSASVGIAIGPDDADDNEGLVRKADEAMYVGKRSGGDRLTRFEPEMAEAAEADARQRQELARALSMGELLLHYQPIFRISTGRIWACEVLLRWRLGGTLIPAQVFIPFAEQSGQIRSLGARVADLLAAEVTQLASGTPPDLLWCINLSAAELEDRIVMERLHHPGLAGLRSRLIVEVTEGLALPPGSPAEEGIRRLKGNGIRIALDDFGTGYANFSTLERLRPSVLKIDGGFVHRAADGDERATAFLRATVAIAGSLGAEVVAEGIETPTQLSTIADLGVDLAQGYYLARPGPMSSALRNTLTTTPS